MLEISLMADQALAFQELRSMELAS
jgi:hypothetical protein